MPTTTLALMLRRRRSRRLEAGGRILPHPSRRAHARSKFAERLLRARSSGCGLRDARTRVRSLPNAFGVRAPQDEAFETRARAFEVCRTPSACALLRMRPSRRAHARSKFAERLRRARSSG